MNSTLPYLRKTIILGITKLRFDAPQEFIDMKLALRNILLCILDQQKQGYHMLYVLYLELRSKYFIFCYFAYNCTLLIHISGSYDTEIYIAFSNATE